MNTILAQQIIEMSQVDHNLRKQAPKGPALEFINYLIYAIDEVHNSRIKRIITEYGFPTVGLIGRDALSAFWLLVQHQRYERKLQEEALAKCDFLPNEKALLTDRILINNGEKQIYGTQFQRSGSMFEPFPIENEKEVNKRRKDMGLSTLEEYLKEVNKK